MLPNNQTLPEIKKFDHFSGFFEREPSKISVIIISFFINLICFLLFYGIIWYEHFGADHKRILTNKLVSMICWNGIAGVPIIYLSDTLMFFFAPFLKEICFFIGLIRFVMKSNLLMFLNAIAIFKFIFIFCLKNPAAVDDDFWSIFISIWSVGFSIIFNFFQFLQQRQQNMYYYICADIDPSEDQHLPGSINTQIEHLVCFFIHVAISLSVKIYNCHHKPLANLQQGTGTNCFLPVMKNINLADFLTNFILLSWFSSLAFFQFQINNFQLEEINSFPYSLYSLSFLYVGSSFSGLIISCAYYSRHSHLRNKLLAELKS